MPIIVSKTFELVTPESAEHGDSEDTGFIFEDQEYTFSELLSELQNEGYMHLSNSGEIDENTWITSEHTQDRDYFEKGHETRYSLHLSSDSHSRYLKYWKAALKTVAL